MIRTCVSSLEFFPLLFASLQWRVQGKKLDQKGKTVPQWECPSTDANSTCVLGKPVVCLWEVQPAPLLTDRLFRNTPKGAEFPSHFLDLCAQLKIHILEWEKSVWPSWGHIPLPEATPTMSPTCSEGRGVPPSKMGDLLVKERHACWVGKAHRVHHTHWAGFHCWSKDDKALALLVSVKDFLSLAVSPSFLHFLRGSSLHNPVPACPNLVFLRIKICKVQRLSPHSLKSLLHWFIQQILINCPLC